MAMHPVRADAGLGGLVFLIVFIALQLLNALRRGKPPEPVPTTPARPAPPRPSYSAKARQIWEDVVPEVPASAPASTADALEEAARRMEAAEVALAAEPLSNHAWSRLGIRGREEWQRGVILSEVLQRPLSLRADW